MTGGGDAVLQVVSNAASITQLASNVTSSLSAIKKALKDMEDLPTELTALRHFVDEGHTKLLNLPWFLQPEDWDRFLPCLESLSVALKSGRDLDVQLAGDQNFEENFLKGLLGSGASKQIPEAKRLKESVERDLHFINGAILELQAQRLKRLESTLSGTSRSTQAPNCEVGVHLESLSKQKVGEEIIEDVLAAPSHRADYQSLTGKEDPVDEDEDDGDHERGSVKGGTYEVANNSKIRLIMKSEEPRYFYVVAFDSSNLEPQLFYPDIPLAKNELQLINRSANSYKRVFPNPILFKKDDPPSWKLTKAAALPSDGVEYCYVYVVFSSSRLESDGEVPTIMDVKRKLDAEGSWSDEEIIVERLQFDVK